MSATMFHDAADSAEPSTNTTVPNTRTGLRPNWSASLPYRGIETVCASR